MKKSLTLGVLTLSTLALVACSKSSSTQESKASSESTSQSLETSSSSSEKVDNKQYDELLNGLNSELNPDGSNDFTSKIENNVKDSNFPEGHTVISITITGETKKSLA